jgi:hypothetical protein
MKPVASHFMRSDNVCVYIHQLPLKMMVIPPEDLRIKEVSG